MTKAQKRNTVSVKNGKFVEKVRRYFEDNAFVFMSAASFLNGSSFSHYRDCASEREEN